MPTIAIFGSSFVQSNEPDYVTTYEIALQLGRAGFSIMTGGYKGVMEAASKGASEAGVPVIGITAAPVEAMRRVKANQWVERIVPYDTLRERVIHLTLRADGYVVMPGGVGTLNELTMAWELMRVREIPPRPLVCYGEYWETMLAPFRQSSYILPIYWENIHFAHTVQDVVELIRKGT